MKKLNFYLLLVLFVLFGACDGTESRFDERLDLLSFEPIVCETIKTTVPFDRYFPDDFFPDSMRSDGPYTISYDSSGLTILKPAGNHFGMRIYNLTISYDGIHYSIPIIESKTRSYLFTYPNFDGIEDIQLIGNFDHIDSNDLHLKLKDGLWIKNLGLVPGTYRYLLKISYKEGYEFLPDPVNPIFEEIGDSTYSVLRIEDDLYCESAIHANYSKNHISLKSNDIEGIYAYWEHFRLEPLEKDGSLQIGIPLFTKYIDSSRITIYCFTKDCVYKPLSFPLRKNKIATATEEVTLDHVRK